MTRVHLKSVLLLLCLLSFQQVKVQELSGQNVLQAGFFESFQFVGNSALASIERVEVSGQNFSEAWRITGKGQTDNIWDAQLGAMNHLPLNQGDTLLLRFWARALEGNARTEFVFEENGSPWTKSVTSGVILDSNWRQVQIPFKTHRAFTAGEASALFRLGYGEQSFELANFSLLSFGTSNTIDDFPTLGFDYAGREADALWRSAANERIDVLRKADLEIRVVDAAGNPVEGLKIEIQQTRHAFAFGSAVDAERLFAEDTDGERYRQTIGELFNWVVLENDLKWPIWECCRKEQALKALDYFAAKDIKVRGHTLIWPCYEDYCLPVDAAVLLDQPEALKERIDEHLVAILAETQGKLIHWDVVNEPSTNKRLADVFGEDIMAEWFTRVKALEPNAQLYLNDFGNLGEGNLDVEYKRILSRMQDLGAPLEGIGLQGHFGWQLTPPEELFERLNSFAEFGLPLMITEFDVNISDESLQADYLRDFFTVAFSHPAVEGILMWGFWENQHWMPDAALYRNDWSPKPNAKAYKDLVLSNWWSHQTNTTDASGSYKTRAFLGDYVISIGTGSSAITQSFQLDRSGQILSFVMID